MLISQNQLSAVYTGLRAIYQEGFLLTASGIEDDWKSIAMEVPSDTEEEEYGWMKNMSTIREWIGDRHLQSLVEASYKIKNKHFEGTISVPADKISDRKLAGFSIPTKQLGQNARVFPNRLVFPLLSAGFSNVGFDGQYFFDTDHPVHRPDGGIDLISNLQAGAGPAWYLLDTTKVIKPIVYQNRQSFNFHSLTDMSKSDHVFMRNEFLFGVDGRCNVGYGLWQTAFASKAPLNLANVAAARATMMAYKGENGEPIGIVPNLMVVPPALEMDARKVTDAIVVGMDTNVMRGVMKTMATSWL
jgi:phage major head subunit gpT-like protein